MKKIEAIIRPYKLDALREALGRIGIGGLTVAEVRGVGREQGVTRVYRGVEMVMDFFPKIRVEIAVSDGKVDSCVDAIIKEVASGKPGDGKIFISNLHRVVRVRTGEEGEDAV